MTHATSSGRHLFLDEAVRRVSGRDAMYAVAYAMGGTHYTFPKRLTSNDILVQILGKDAAEKIGRLLGGPGARRWCAPRPYLRRYEEVCRLQDKGHEPGYIAEQLGVKESTVRSYLERRRTEPRA